MRALVSGSNAGGIGGAISRRLVADALGRDEPSHLVMTATRETPEFTGLADELRARGARVLTLTGDISDADAAVALTTAAIEFCDGLDALIANAGTAHRGTLRDASLDHWDLMFNLHARAPWLMARTAYEALRASRGSIVLTGSMAATMPHPGIGLYSASKAAAHMLVQGMALEWGPQGIRANVVAPGPIVTEISGKTHGDPQVVAANAERRRRALPIRRLGVVDDIAAAVSYLAGPQSGFVTGTVLHVDGGFFISGAQQLFPPAPDGD